MNFFPVPRGVRSAAVFLLVVLVLVSLSPAGAQEPAPDPSVYLNFDEGSGTFALDSSGHGNAATLHNVSRTETGGCGKAIVFSNPDSYVEIPYRTLNHPDRAITVSAWFLADDFSPASLVSTHHDGGGYRLGFGDGDDLWWTLNLERAGDVSLAIPHESIAPRQWHQVTGTYDGESMKIYLDGILRNQLNTTGRIHYESANYVMLGAEAGIYDTPLFCPPPLRGSLDEVRIYPVALNYNQVMDDRYRCIEGTRSPPGPVPQPAPESCEPVSGSLVLGINESAARVLSFPGSAVNGSWQVTFPPGAVLSVHAVDQYAKAAPDSWYLEIADETGRPARTIAFPARNNAPAEAPIPSGNATVTIRYFSGEERFPATVLLTVDVLPAPQKKPQPVPILTNPIIVIYSASWATVVAIILVMMWLHRRKKEKEENRDIPAEPPGPRKEL